MQRLNYTSPYHYRMKLCNICKIGREKSYFYKHPTNPDGLSYKCKSCSILQNKLNRINNGDTIRQNAKDKYGMNKNGYKEYMLEYQKKYRKEHPEKINEYAKKYREKMRVLVNAKIAAYRKTPSGRFKARQKQLKRERMVQGTYTKQEWDDLLKRYPHCLKCRTSFDQCAPTDDHIVPIARGGTNIISNIQPLCRPCNSSNGAMAIDFRPQAVDNRTR